jgi:hypothetical protein
MTRRHSLKTGAAVAALTAAVTCTGCGGGGAVRGVATLPGHRTSGGGGTGLPTAAQSDRDMIGFTRCMRARGVSMSDPFHRPGHQGLSIDVPPHDTLTNPAYAACNHFLQPLITAKLEHATQTAARDLPALTRYAECMRNHDIPMLDPTWFGALNLGNVPGINNDYGRYTPQFRQADSTCRHLLPAQVHDDGTGP